MITKAMVSEEEVKEIEPKKELFPLFFYSLLSCAIKDNC